MGRKPAIGLVLVAGLATFTGCADDRGSRVAAIPPIRRANRRHAIGPTAVEPSGTTTGVNGPAGTGVQPSHRAADANDRRGYGAPGTVTTTGGTSSSEFTKIPTTVGRLVPLRLACISR